MIKRYTLVNICTSLDTGKDLDTGKGVCVGFWHMNDLYALPILFACTCVVIYFQDLLHIDIKIYIMHI